MEDIDMTEDKWTVQEILSDRYVAEATASLRDEDHSDEYPPLGQVVVTSMVWAAEVSSLNPEMDGFAGRWTAAPASQSMSASAGLGGYIQKVFLA